MIAVVDASVALKWQFQDEEATDKATGLLSDFIDGKVQLIAPTLFSYEIVSAINVAINRKRITEADGYRAIKYLTSLDIDLWSFVELIDKVMREFDLAKQMEICIDMERMAYKDATIVPIVSSNFIVIQNPKIKDAYWFWAGGPKPCLKYAWLDK